jgi:hypothetical protein
LYLQFSSILAHNITIMSAVEQKKESIRVALQELESPSSERSAYEAMETLYKAVIRDFDDDPSESIGDFVGDDDFKEEIFSARVVQVVMDVSQDKNAYPPNFYHLSCCALHSLCCDNVELANAFLAHDGDAFLLESLEAFSSDQFLLTSCFTVHNAVIESLDEIESAAFAGMTLGKLVDVFELNLETADAKFYQHYCLAVSIGLGPHLDDDVKNKCFHRIVSHVWHGITMHKHDDEVQDLGRRFLRYLVGEETAKKMIDHAEMHHCEDEECAGCA